MKVKKLDQKLDRMSVAIQKVSVKFLRLIWVAQIMEKTLGKKSES